jgi:hypothetical protein
MLWISNRPAILIEAFRPIQLGKSLAHKEFAGLPVEDIEEAIAIGPEHNLTLFAVPVNVR